MFQVRRYRESIPPAKSTRSSTDKNEKRKKKGGDQPNGSSPRATRSSPRAKQD